MGLTRREAGEAVREAAATASAGAVWPGAVFCAGHGEGTCRAVDGYEFGPLGSASRCRQQTDCANWKFEGRLHERG